MRDMKNKGLLETEDFGTVRRCLELTRKFGADAARVKVVKSVETSVCSRDGELDSISYKAGKGVFFYVLAGGRSGFFEAHNFDDTLEEVIRDGVEKTKLLTPDPPKLLPPKELKAIGMTRGDELDLVDPSFNDITVDRRTALVRRLASAVRPSSGEWHPLSMECEYYDSLYDTYMIDSEGFEGRNTNSGFSYGAFVTIEDNDGNKYSGARTRFSICLDELKADGVTDEAFALAAAKLHPRGIRSGRYNVVVDRVCGARLLSPLLDALDALSIQQKYSFLCGRLGERVFADSLNIIDRQAERHKTGSAPFDRWGVECREMKIIEKGVILTYYTDAETSARTGFPITPSECLRPCIEPFICNCNEKEITLERILSESGEGIYITDFNGGNTNPATGEFSFGIEGFAFRDGRIMHPVKNALMTGDMISLWNRIYAAGSDPRDDVAAQIPTLAFKGIDISAQL